MFSADELILIARGNNRGFLDNFPEVVGQLGLPFVRMVKLVDFDYFFPNHLAVDFALEQYFGGEGRNLLHDAVQKMLTADVVVMQFLGQPLRGDQSAFGSGRKPF
jgi:hypothetical protein